MGGVNRPVIITTAVIAGYGVVTVWQRRSGSVTRVLLGAYVLMGVLSLADLIPLLRPLVSGIALVALVGIVLSPELWGLLGQVLAAHPAQ